MASPIARLLGKKQSEETDQEVIEETTEQTPAAPEKKKRKSKPNEMMASVISETVPQTAVDVLRQNHRFVLADNTSWAILVLPVDVDSPFGGLSKKNQRDEEKGQIIGLIEDDTIQTAMTPNMLVADVLGIIPSEQTIDRMKEYQILTTQKYFWGVVTTNEDRSELFVEYLKGPSFDDVVQIAEGQAELSALYPYVFRYTQDQAGNDGVAPDEDVTEATHETAEETEVLDPADESVAFDEQTSPQEQPVTTHASPETDEVVEEPDDGITYETLDDTDDFDDGGDYDDAPDVGAMLEVQEDAGAQGTVVTPADDEDDFLDDDGEYDEGSGDDVDQDDGDAEYVEQLQGQVIAEAQVRDQIVQRFMTGDLDLDVSLDPFEKTFQSKTPAIVFEIGDDTSSWLGSQVAQLVRQANTELSRLRQDHMDKLRSRYVELMGTQVEDINQKVSIDREDTVYHDLRQSADRDFEDSKRQIEAERAATTKDLQQHFEMQADAVGKQAYETARAQYITRYAPREEERLANVGNEILRRHEENYHHKQQTILDLRKQEAHRRMDFGISYALRVLAEFHAEQQKREHLVLNEWNERLLKYIDQHRQSDIARANAMAEQLARDNSIAQLQEEHTAEMERRESEFQERLRRAQLEIDRVHEQAQAERQQIVADWEHRYEQLNTEWEHATESNRRRIAALKQEVTQVDERERQRDAEHQADIQRYKDVNEQYAHQLQQSGEVQSRSNKVLIVLVIVLGLAALFAGAFIGFGYGLGYE